MKRSIWLLSALITVLFTFTWCHAAEQAEPRVTIDLSGHPVRGAVDAPVTVVVFSDYL